MGAIVSSIVGVTTIMSEISAASVEQTSGIEQVNQAVAQMDDVTQQNAALVEQAAASAEALEEQAQNLSITVSSFKVDSNLRSPLIKTTASVQKNQQRQQPSTPPVTGNGNKRYSQPVKPNPTVFTNNDEWEEF